MTGFFIQSKPEEVKEAVLTAIDVGYRLIDTAYVYGNEHVIGEALQEAFKANKVKREELFITTKVCPLIFLYLLKILSAPYIYKCKLNIARWNISFLKTVCLLPVFLRSSVLT